MKVNNKHKVITQLPPLEGRGGLITQLPPLEGRGGQ